MMLESDRSSLTILQLAEDLRQKGLSWSILFLRIAQGAFPHQISHGGRAIGWVNAVVDNRINARANLGSVLAEKVAGITLRSGLVEKVELNMKDTHSSTLVVAVWMMTLVTGQAQAGIAAINATQTVEGRAVTTPIYLTPLNAAPLPAATKANVSSAYPAFTVHSQLKMQGVTPHKRSDSWDLKQNLKENREQTTAQRATSWDFEARMRDMGEQQSPSLFEVEEKFDTAEEDMTWQSSVISQEPDNFNAIRDQLQLDPDHAAFADEVQQTFLPQSESGSLVTDERAIKHSEKNPLRDIKLNDPIFNANNLLSNMRLQLRYSDLSRKLLGEVESLPTGKSAARYGQANSRSASGSDLNTPALRIRTTILPGK